MKRTVMSIVIACVFSGAGAGCAADGSSAAQAAQAVTSAIQQHLVRHDDDLCNRWNECYLGCAAMPCDDEATCAEQQAAYASCDVSDAPAADYCPLPG
jgi:hypothetical protein